MRRKRIIRLFAAFLACAAPAWGGEADLAKDRIVAKILLKLPHYIQSEGASKPAICVVKNDVLFRFLSEARSLNKIQLLGETDAANACVLVYIDDHKVARSWLLKNAHPKVILISSYARFTEEGGAMALVENEGRIEIHLNLTAAKKNSAAFSPDLIEISKRVIQ